MLAWEGDSGQCVFIFWSGLEGFYGVGKVGGPGAEAVFVYSVESLRGADYDVDQLGAISSAN
jgi:hypothetical protein